MSVALSRLVGRLFVSSAAFRRHVEDRRWLEFAVLVNEAPTMADLPEWAQEWLEGSPLSGPIREHPGAGHVDADHAGKRGGGSGGGEPRKFTSEEGFAWHEQHRAWAEALPEDQLGAITGYAGFGSNDINSVLRGAELTKTFYRPATPEEKQRFRDWMNRPASDTSDPQPPEPAGPGSRFMDFGDEVAYPGPDTERMARVQRDVELINTAIKAGGVTVSEDMEVLRAAYVPGLSPEALKDSEGTVITEKGFSSTMVGDANGRLDGYIALGKGESIYRRTGKVVPDFANFEVGSAMKLHITVPKGAKVASVEAARKYGGGRKTDQSWESELLLPSGARFRVDRVVLNAGVSMPGRDVETKFHEVWLTYVPD